MRWPILFAVVIPATLLGAIVGGLRVRYRAVEGSDLEPPPGYARATQLGELRLGQTIGTGNAIVVALWFKRDIDGGLWIARLDDKGTGLIGHGELYLKAFEQGMRKSAEKHGRTVTIKSRESKDIAGREVARIDAIVQGINRRMAAVRVGNTELLLNADSPINDAELHATGFDAMLGQVARMPAPEHPRAERTAAAGQGAGIGFGASLLPGIGLAAILRRRR
jgi:hypothetical protein